MVKSAFNIFHDNGNRELTRFISERLRDILAKEKNGEVYNSLEECLQKEINQNIIEGDYESASKIIGILKQHRSEEKTPSDDFIKDIIEPENVSLLIEDLLSDKQNIKDKAFEILSKLKHQLYPHFIKAIANTEVLRKRYLLIGLIKSQGGKKAINEFLNYIEQKLSIVELTRILEVIDCFGDNSLVIEKLDKLLSHYDFRVRKEVIKVLEK